MKRRYQLATIVLVIAILAIAPISARMNSSLAVGAQFGFLATGIVADIPLGPLALQAGVNYPVGWLYIQSLAGGDDFGDFFNPFFVLTADITAPIGLGENFDLKLGVSTLGFTDFESGVFGVAGPAVKGEYWLAEKEVGLYVNLNVPIMGYILTADGSFDWIIHQALPLAGLFTTTAGVLWSL